MRNNKGQTALILILVAALAMVFFAISLNWGTIAQIKTVTMTASTLGSSSLASSYASYGEYQIQTTLGGRIKYCKSTGFLAAIIGFIIAVIAFIVSIYCGGCFAYPILAVVLASVSLVLSIANIILQLAVIQPGLTKLWNKMQQNLAPTDQYLEQALMNSLQSSATDTVNLTDYFDLNTNGRLGLDAANGAADLVSRLAFFYTERLKSMDPPVGSTLGPFFDGNPGGGVVGLKQVIEALGDNCTDLNDPHCNPCCLPLINPETGANVRPSNDGMGHACPMDPVPAQCLNTSVWPYSPSYPFSYDPSYPNFSTNSTLALLGADSPVDPFRMVDAKGFFNALWAMDGLKTDPNYAPGSGDTRGSDNINTTAIAHFKNTYTSPSSLDPQCPTPTDAAAGFYWRNGADIYCPTGTQWPYDACFAGSCNPDGSGCTCTPHEDPVDDVIQGLRQFYVWGKDALDQWGKSNAQMTAAIDQWWPQAAPWIGASCGGTNCTPYCDPATSGGSENSGGSCTPTAPGGVCQYCYNSNPTGGTSQWPGGQLYAFKNVLEHWWPILDDWLKANYADDGSWCVPATTAMMPATEVTAINASIAAKGSSWGSIDSTLACLQYETDPTTANDVLFHNCVMDRHDACISGSAAAPVSCLALPRSVISTAPPAYDCGAGTAYDNWLNSSYSLAQAQVIKFKARYNYLNDMQQKLIALRDKLCAPGNAVKATDTSGYAYVQTCNSGFLKVLSDFTGVDADKPSAAIQSLIDMRKGVAAPPYHPLENQITYGWQDLPKNGRTEGYWHLVRVEGMSPGAPNNPASGLDQGWTLTNRLPWVRTYTTGGFFNQKRCYELTDAHGRVMLRITRWDEDHDPITFANRFPIWRLIFKPGGPGTVSDTLKNECLPKTATDVPIGIRVSRFNNLAALWGSDTHDTKTYLDHAFMLNRYEADSGKKNCWDAVNDLLTRGGVKSQTCLEYWADGSNNHMNMKYVQCP